MSYDSARTALSTALAAVAIADPAALTITKVYADPPASPQDFPCFVLYGSRGTEEHNFGGTTARETHTERVRFLVEDEDLERSAAIVRAFRMATLAALRVQGGLGGAATVQSVTWEEPAGFNYAGSHRTGQDYLITFHVKAP